MKEFLTEDEARVSRKITNITDNLPPSVGKFVLNMEDDKAFGTIYSYVNHSKLFYSVLAEKWNVNPKKIVDKDLLKVDLETIEAFLNTYYKPMRINSELTPPTKKNKSA